MLSSWVDIHPGMNAANWTTVFTSLFEMTVSLDIAIQMRWGKIHCIQNESLFEEM